MVVRKRKKRKILPVSEVTLTPLIDTALTLLIIFMITAPMMQNSIKVRLPKGEAKEAANDTQDIIVEIDKDGKIFLGKNSMSCEELVVEIKKRVEGIKNIDSENKIVFVKADKEVNYGRVINVVDQIKVVGGISHVALATQKYA